MEYFNMHFLSIAFVHPFDALKNSTLMVRINDAKAFQIIHCHIC